MPGPEFIVPTQRIEDFVYGIQVTGDRAVDMEPALQGIMDKLLARERRMFETRGASSGRYWAPLKGATVKTKIREGSAHPFDPLRDSDSLMESLSRRGAPLQILDVSEEGLTLGTTHKAAQFHQEGTSKMPARPPLIVPAKHAHEYIGDLNDFLFGSHA